MIVKFGNHILEITTVSNMALCMFIWSHRLLLLNGSADGGLSLQVFDCKTSTHLFQFFFIAQLIHLFWLHSRSTNFSFVWLPTAAQSIHLFQYHKVVFTGNPTQGGSSGHVMQRYLTSTCLIMWQVVAGHYLPLQYIHYLIGSKYNPKNLFQASLGNDYLYEVSRGVLSLGSPSNKDSYTNANITLLFDEFQGVWGRTRWRRMYWSPRRCHLWLPQQVYYQLPISEWQLAKLWWDDIIIQMGKYIPEFTFTVQRTWDGSKALQTSYVSYYCEPPKKVHRLHNYSLNHFQVCRWCFNTSPRTLPAWLVGNSSVCFWFLMYTYMTWILPIFKKN